MRMTPARVRRSLFPGMRKRQMKITTMAGPRCAMNACQRNLMWLMGCSRSGSNEPHAPLISEGRPGADSWAVVDPHARHLQLDLALTHLYGLGRFGRMPRLVWRAGVRTYCIALWARECALAASRGARRCEESRWSGYIARAVHGRIVRVREWVHTPVIRNWTGPSRVSTAWAASAAC